MILVFRGVTTENWNKRCLYLSKEYYPKVPYNHRTILDCEIIIEYDNDDIDLNNRLANRVIKKLSEDNIKYSKWDTSNKSAHIHFLLKNSKVSNLPLFKNVVMRHYGTFYVDKDTKRIYDKQNKDETLIKVFPDMRLASPHLIRAEFGIHEKTQGHKKLMCKSPNYPCKSMLPVTIFEKYNEAQERSTRQRICTQTADLSEHDTVKKLMDTVKFQESMDDGRERVMFALIHILKPKYMPDKKDELVNLLDEWYGYCSSQPRKMTKIDIQNKVRYHWSKNYTVTEHTLKRIIEEVGGTI
jgi:hypothetical protein